jgi:hypothetical protein
MAPAKEKNNEKNLDNRFWEDYGLTRRGQCLGMGKA